MTGQHASAERSTDDRPALRRPRANARGCARAQRAIEDRAPWHAARGDAAPESGRPLPAIDARPRTSEVQAARPVGAARGATRGRRRTSQRQDKTLSVQRDQRDEDRRGPGQARSVGPARGTTPSRSASKAATSARHGPAHPLGARWRFGARLEHAVDDGVWLRDELRRRPRPPGLAVRHAQPPPDLARVHHRQRHLPAQRCSASDSHLIAHELTHVVQQRSMSGGGGR